MRKIFLIYLISTISVIGYSQDFGDFPKIEKEKLLRDLELLYQGLDKYHSGMYWYTPKDSVDMLFDKVKEELNRDMNVLEFHKLIAPLVGLSREDHTDIYLPDNFETTVYKQATFLPLTIVFLGEKLYCVKNASSLDVKLEGKEIESINGETPTEIVNKIGSLFASDGYIKTVKLSDLEDFEFSKYYYYYYGNISSFKIKIAGEDLIELEPLAISSIKENAKKRYPTQNREEDEETETLEFRILNPTTAYLGVHTFSNSSIKKNSINNNLEKFFENSFKTIQEKKIENLIIDVSKNGGGNEGNENLLYSYIGKNYRKYTKVKAKSQEVILDNGIDKPIKLKTFGALERKFGNNKMPDGSYERKKNVGFGLCAFKKEPRYKYNRKLFLIISPVTYSGGSEFSNMVYTNGLATFVGQETGGGYYGNTSGYSRELTLPHSGIMIDIPSLKFEMNVDPKLPKGRGVIPDIEVIPTFEQFTKGKNAALNYILGSLIE